MPDATSARTAGPWFGTSDRVYAGAKSAMKGGRLVAIAVRNKASVLDEEGAANTSFIAEAGTIAHETGLSPRQLAEQREQLLEVLVRVMMWEPKSTEAACEQDYMAAQAIIAKIKGKS